MTEISRKQFYQFINMGNSKIFWKKYEASDGVLRFVFRHNQLIGTITNRGRTERYRALYK